MGLHTLIKHHINAWFLGDKHFMGSFYRYENYPGLGHNIEGYCIFFIIVTENDGMTGTET